MTKISVIIPVYNVEKYLADCLKSIMNQTLSDIEIICVNDGSTDNSLKILKDYSVRDSRIKIINQTNKGAGAARNRGLEIAKGEYLYFIDSDDFADKKILEKLYKKITKTNSDICVCKNIYWDMDKHKKFNSYNLCIYPALPLNLIRGFYYKNKVINRYNSAEKLFQTCNIPAYTKLYRHDFIKQHGIKFQEIPTCNDVFFNFYSLACAESISLLYKKLVVHRIGHLSLTKTRGKNAGYILEAFEELEKRLKEDGIFDDLAGTFYKRAESCFKYELEQVENKQDKKYWEAEFCKFLNTQEKDLILQRG
jgi:glycosyltransferase involved in cell wall biosynthesis